MSSNTAEAGVLVTKTASLAPRVRFGSIEIDPAAHSASVSGTSVALTTREAELLVYLTHRTGRLLTRQQLLSDVWGPGYTGGNRTVDIHVSRLRRKLGRELPLVTLRRAGYRLDAPRSPNPSETAK